MQRLFPFHLISACSTAQRDMCQFASREELGLEAQGRIGFRGTYVDVEERSGVECRLAPPLNPPTPAFGALDPRSRVPSSLASIHTHATCRTTILDGRKADDDSASFAAV